MIEMCHIVGGVVQAFLTKRKEVIALPKTYQIKNVPIGLWQKAERYILEENHKAGKKILDMRKLIFEAMFEFLKKRGSDVSKDLKEWN